MSFKVKTIVVDERRARMGAYVSALSSINGITIATCCAENRLNTTQYILEVE